MIREGIVQDALRVSASIFHCRLDATSCEQNRSGLWPCITLQRLKESTTDQPIGWPVTASSGGHDRFLAHCMYFHHTLLSPG